MDDVCGKKVTEEELQRQHKKYCQNYPNSSPDFEAFRSGNYWHVSEGVYIEKAHPEYCAGYQQKPRVITGDLPSKGIGSGW